MHAESSDGRLGLAVLYDCDQSKFPLGPLVDIVAVHGIGADPDRTWTRNGVNWLRDEKMLPQAVPQARIMRFGYESQWLGREAVQQRLSLVSDQLLCSLVGSRKTCPHRPLIFVGHCFGGLVIEKALLSAKVHEDDYPGVAWSTAGIIFLGTPHRGSNSQSKASMIATIASIVGIGERSQVLKSVEKDSDTLADMIHDFTRLANSSSIPLFCFFEQHKSDAAKLFRPKGTPIWPTYRDIIVDEYSASIDGHPKLGLALDHFQMNRFSGNQDSNYRFVCDEILRFVQLAPERIRGKTRAASRFPLSSEIQNQQDQSCLQALFITNPFDDMKMIENKRDRVMERSASWILRDDSFQSWLNADSSSLLWLHGDPGKGKTMLAISLVQELNTKIRLEDSSSQAILAYFFCDNKDDRRKSATSILRGIIYQILIQMPGLCFYFRTEYEKQKEHLLNSPNTLQTLWRILQNIFSHPATGKIYIVIDALDECDPASADDFLALLEPYTNPPEVSKNRIELPSVTPIRSVKILLTSRNEVAIRQRMFESLKISLEQNSASVENAVRAYVDMKVQHLQRQKRYDEKLAAFVKEQLLLKAEGTFLWAALACRELAKPAVRLLQTKSVLLRLPSGLTPLYDRIMDQILSSEEESRDHAKAILRAMVVAQRPYTLEELAVVTDLPEEYHHETAVLEDHVDILCGSMVDIRKGIVYFVHISARDYILTTKGILSDILNLDHENVALHCFHHVCSSKADDAGDPLHIERKASLVYDRLEYPVLFWLDHVRYSPESISDKVSADHSFFRPNSRLRADWFSAFWDKRHAHWEERPSNFAGLHLAAYADIPWLVSALLSASNGAPIDLADSLGNTPLIWAARMGSDKSISVLLAQGADTGAKNRDGVTALFLAAAYGHKMAVQLLAKSGASLSVTDRLGWTALHRAIDQGHTDVVLCLLQNGAPIEAKDGGTWTALYRAVSSGQVAVIKILMEHNANAEVPDREGMTLLQTASWNGHEDVVSILLRYSTDIDAPDQEGWTALHHAAWNGHARVIELLMQNKAEADVKNLEGNTPLYHAAWNGHATAVQALIRLGANVNEVCTDAETALQQAAWRGHSSVVQILLEAGANPNARSKLGSSALHQAASNGQEAIAKLLLGAGADVNLETQDGQTAYEAAKENSYYELARYLESRGGHVPDEEDKSEVDGMDERRTGLDADPAIADILGLDQKLLVMQDHGDACSSEPFKITASVGREKRYYFVKTGPNGEMFKGEHASLQALNAVVPSICPLSLGFGKLSASPGHFLLTEFLDVNAQTCEKGSGLSFAQKLAALHSAALSPPEGYNQAMFGFPVTTYAGRTRQDNTFRRSWAKFYAENRLRTISKLIEQAHGTDDELRTWIERIAAEIVPKLLGNGHLGGKRGISPVLVHGDLWSGNKARGRLGGRGGIEDVAFDASCCYAHSEYELGLMRMFGGFSAGFFSEYHRLVRKTSPQNEYEDRMKLYQLYHWLNNWVLFRGGYRDDAMDCMQELYAKYGDREEEES